MTNWSTARIGDFCATGTGGTPSREDLRRYYEGGTIPWVKSGELRENIIANTEEQITETALRESNAKLVPEGTLLLAMYGASVGRLGILGVPAATNQAVCHIIPDPKIAETRYLFHLLRSRTGELIRRGVGGAQPNINQAIIRELAVPMPPLPEQRRIAEILDRAEALRAKRRTALAQLDTLTQATFLDLFGDPAVNPRKWPVAKIADVANVQGGLQLSGARTTYPCEVPYLRVANVYRGFLDLTEIKTLRATEGEISRTMLEKDDLLVVEGHGNPEEIGRSALWDDSIPGCVHQNHLIRVRFDTGRVSPVYACAYLNSPGGQQHLLRAGKTTSGLNTISVSDVRGAPIALPPISLQRQYDGCVTALEKLKTAHHASLAQLNALFAVLQHRAFRGEL